jgi:hypothetical protein
MNVIQSDPGNVFVRYHRVKGVFSSAMIGHQSMLNRSRLRDSMYRHTIHAQ